MQLRTLATLLVLLIGSGRAAHVACLERDGSVEIESAWSGCCESEVAPSEKAGLRADDSDSCAGCSDFPVRSAMSVPQPRSGDAQPTPAVLPAGAWACLLAPRDPVRVRRGESDRPPPILTAHRSVVLLC